MVPRFRSIATPLLLAALVVLAGACSKKSDPPVTDSLTQEEADDIVLMVSAMAATDSGGWLTPPEVTFINVPHDTVFTRGFVNWNLDYTYFDADSLPPLQAYDSTVVSVACVENGLGRIPVGSGGGGGLYAHTGDVSVTFVGDDTVSIGGFAQVDSAMITIGSGTTARYYYLDNVVEYLYEMHRNPVTAFPVSGEAQIDAFVDFLDTPTRADRFDQKEVVVVITFDGTQTPLATIAPNVLDPPVTYRYRVNLKTGAITRAP